MNALIAWSYGLQWYEIAVVVLLLWALLATGALFIVTGGTKGDD